MSIQIQGTIERKGFGPGTWAIVGNDGETYELHQAPKDLQQAGLKVTIRGQIRDDIMTFAMIGPVLEVEQFDLVE
jgi:hypothetical protein